MTLAVTKARSNWRFSRRARTDFDAASSNVSCAITCTSACSTDASCIISAVSSPCSSYAAIRSPACVPTCTAVLPVPIIILRSLPSCQSRKCCSRASTNPVSGIDFVGSRSLRACCARQHLLHIELAVEVGGSLIIKYTCWRWCYRRGAGEHTFCRCCERRCTGLPECDSLRQHPPDERRHCEVSPYL